MPGLPSADAAHAVIALVRHGATDNNLAHPPLIQGRRLDPPLSAAGQREALRLAAWMAEDLIAGVYASPLLRARQTAEAVARPRGLRVAVVEPLTEADVGRWEGRTWQDVQASEPEAFERFQADPARWPYAGGESLVDVAARAVPALQRIAAAHVGQAVVVVAHNVVNRALLAAALGLPLAEARKLPQHNGGLSLLRGSAERMAVVTVNSIVHLVE